MSPQTSYQARVERERVAHDSDDVLGNNLRLKERLFGHTIRNPYFTGFMAKPDTLLDPLAGKAILELGCGHGERAVKLARGGASVAAIDISQAYVEDARLRAEAEGLPAQRCRFMVMDCHALDFPANSFDAVCGDAILHHLDLEVVLAEIARVLRPGGAAIFIEPLAANPLLKVFRAFTPAARTIDEKPLTRADLKKMAQAWDVLSEYYGLVCAPAAVVTSLVGIGDPHNRLVRAAAAVESRLNRTPAIQPFNQYVLLHLVKKA